MRRSIPVLLVVLLIGVGSAMAQGKATMRDWSFNATIIEACSCPMFCQCYFNTKPAAHSHHGKTEHFCRANFGYRVNKGHYGEVKLDGVEFWLAGDLGEDFSQMQASWIEATFEPSTTKAQREALAAILAHVYPLKFKSFTVAPDASVDWKASKDRAEARLDGGKKGEIVLARAQGMSNEPIVIKNLRYFGVPRHTGFVLMPNEVEAYRVGDKAFEFKGTNGFMITIDINSKDVK
jgi:hypothetical protein